MELELVLSAIKSRIETLSEKQIDENSIYKNVDTQFDVLDIIALLYDERDISNVLSYCLKIIEQTLATDDNEFAFYDRLRENPSTSFDGEPASFWAKSELKRYKDRILKITAIINETEPVSFNRIPLSITKNQLGILIKVLYNSNIIDNSQNLKDIAYTLNRVFLTRGQTKKRDSGQGLAAAVSNIDQDAYAEIVIDLLPKLKKEFDKLKLRSQRTT
jgi:hypothetical protein